MAYLASLHRYRYLLVQWTSREVRVRYKQSLLGIAWAILQPLALTLVFTAVFSRLMRVDTGEIPYPVFVYSAMLPWSFFANSLAFGIPSLVNNMNLVTKVYFPREILPLGTLFSGLIDFLAGSLVLVGLLAYYRIPLSGQALWVLPLFGTQLMLTAAVTLLGAALIVFFRDVRFVIPLLTQVWMYATPVVYPTELVPDRWRTLYFLNPMAGIIDGYRRVLVMGMTPIPIAIVSAVSISLIALVSSYLLFKRVEPLFTDVI